MVRRPLRARVRRGPLSFGAAPAACAHLALLLEDAGGLRRLDLVDLSAAPQDVRTGLAGAVVLDVVIRR